MLSFFRQMTMYRAVLYFLVLLAMSAMILSRTGALSFISIKGLLLQTALFIAICWMVNLACARIVKTQANSESLFITAFILTLIVGPLSFPDDLLALVVIAAVAMASKYLLVWNKSHIFNPAAFGVIAGFFLVGTSASWWVGTGPMVYPILIGGLYIVRKIRRTHLVVSFFATYGLLAIVYGVLTEHWTLSTIGDVVRHLILSPTLLFFAFVMLVEPLTAPQTRLKRIWFGVLVGVVLFLFQTFTPAITYAVELSLLVGNVFAFAIGQDFRQMLALRKKEKISPTAMNFWFEPSKPFSFTAGQFLEYTLAHPQHDLRGLRRYFTIASAPEEKQVLLSTKFAEKGSTFKKTLEHMQEGDTIIASKLAGDFILPKDASQKLAFIAGGIGITPFRSMVKHLLMTGASRDIVLLYGVRTESDLAFKEVFEEAHRTFGMKNIYVVNAKIDAERIRQDVPDFQERLFYISGPEPMVEGMEKTLAGLGIPSNHIKRDYFPGYDI